MLTYTITWLSMVILAIIDTVIRDKVYKETVGELRAHQISTFTGIIRHLQCDKKREGTRRKR
jgi:hypothetical protein